MTTIKITRKLAKVSHEFPVGTVVEAEASSLPGMREVSPGRWGTDPVTGRFCELERAVYERIEVPTWSIRSKAGYLVAIPRDRAVEI